MYGHRETPTAGNGDYNTIRVTSEGTFRYPESYYQSIRHTCPSESRSKTMSLPVPPLKTLRIASPQDVLRIGEVAACSFSYSPVFDWERPYHKKFPEDTLLSYRNEFTSFIKNPEYVVLVAVDKYDPDESKKSLAIIPPNNGAETPAKGDEVIVGVACYKLVPGSKRKGQFNNETGTIYFESKFVFVLTLEYRPLPSASAQF